VTGEQLLNHSNFNDARLRSLSTYVEQEDFLVGSLTVAETVGFAAKLALPPTLGPTERAQRIEDMIRDFGLTTVKASCIGTPLKRGVSGGEKRRVTTASQLITLPKVIFLGTAFLELAPPSFNTPAD
jgi:ABC-type multidrug transport system ATPase subunit